jgi:hypothetical protein
MGWNLRTFGNTKAPVWEWIKKLADQRGAQLRMRWHEGTGINDFVLVLEVPDRAKSTADFTLDPTLGQCALSPQNVRNAWRVGYALNGGEATATDIATDSASINKYGRLYAEMSEGSGSQIDTATEANTLRDNNLADTKEPTAQVSLSLPYRWNVQLNDLVEVKADGFYFEADQKLAVLSRRNTIQQGGPASTILKLEGLPKIGTKAITFRQRVFRVNRPSPNFTQSSINYGGMAANATLSDLSNE